ncbi:MAG: type II toxin-antitoxin system HicA family toxin [archaeon]|nr:type II toxin-antitoxin system HicA family toxin [archaeon]MCP8314102.1 type II toxin-antitoxin system HicA family toxin [archaeon]MCP8317873.1 type II toxin-antitoxin system HicA family toxin [archaeon]MCP8319753.1 type II toxin-antitoxin system HicA family toxin [archaeon]
MKSPSKKLPVLSWREVIKALQKAGFTIAHQKGSHIILSKHGKFIAVPKHEEIAKGTLMSIIRDAGLTKEEFLKLI